jgi:tight adherence protein C
MLDLLTGLLKPDILLIIVIGLAVFATVLTLAAPAMQNDELKARMKSVNAEREKLKASHRSQVAGKESKLRDKREANLARQVVDALNLRSVFEAESSRTLLRTAGLRSERHFFIYLVVRLVTPILLAIIAYGYLTALFPDLPGNRVVIMVVVATLVGFFLPVTFVKNLVARRQDSIRRAWSDALDLMLICVESGLAVEPALVKVAGEIGTASVPLAEELTLTVAELSYLQERRKAFENLAKRTGMPAVKSVVTSLIQSERYGTPLGAALRVLAQENRDARLAEAERKAAALPPRLTVPMILFFLPVIFVVILGPSIIRVLELR